MSILKNHFYHRTIISYMNLFGSIFNDLKIIRDDGKTIEIPIAYASGQKHQVANDELPDQDASRHRKVIVPRMSFQLVSFEKDAARQKGSKTFSITGVVDTEATETPTQYNRVPYNFDFRLDAYTKNLDDLMQIVEQVCPVFNPAIQIEFNDNPGLGVSSVINVVMPQAPSLEDVFEGAFEEERVLELGFNFKLEGFLYMPTRDQAIIKSIDLNYFEMGLTPAIGTDVIA